VDRGRANFCEYHHLADATPNYTKVHKRQQAKAQLAALFGESLDDVDPAAKATQESLGQIAQRTLHEWLNQQLKSIIWYRYIRPP
jgi:hypothetical protein